MKRNEKRKMTKRNSNCASILRVTFNHGAMTIELTIAVELAVFLKHIFHRGIVDTDVVNAHFDPINRLSNLIKSSKMWMWK